MMPIGPLARAIEARAELDLLRTIINQHIDMACLGASTAQRESDRVAMEKCRAEARVLRAVIDRFDEQTLPGRI